MIRMRLFLQLFQAQSTGLQQPWPPAEMAARWPCGLLIKNLRTHYNCQFCVSFHCSLFLSGPPQTPLNGSKWSLQITMLSKKNIFS